MPNNGDSSLRGRRMLQEIPKLRALEPVRQRLDAPNPLQAEEVSAAMARGDETGLLVAPRDEPGTRKSCALIKSLYDEGWLD